MKRWIAFLAGLALTVALPVQAFAVKVVVDPGHGGLDSGAISVNGLRESVVNTDIALKLRDELVRRGYDVLMTKEAEGAFLSLAERVDISRAANADLFVSIHANDFPPSSAVQGSMVLYYDDANGQSRYPASEEMRGLTPQSRELAQRVLDALVSSAGTVNKGLLPSVAFVVRNGDIPSILVETAFLSNSQDAGLLADPNARTRIAVGIADGIQAYTPPVFADLRGHWATAAIREAKNRGVIEGEGNRFYPDRSLTRAEFLTIMDRIFNFDRMLETADVSKPAASSTAAGGAVPNVTGATYSPDRAGTPGSKPPTPVYRDLNAKHWAFEMMSKAAKLGLVYGYSDGTARPDRAITRAEVAVLFDRLLQPKTAATGGSATPSLSAAATTPAAFADVAGDLWSASAIYRLYAKGLIDGIGAGSFAPDRGITRAEMAALIDRYYRTVK